jgi:hypothetical protein
VYLPAKEERWKHRVPIGVSPSIIQSPVSTQKHWDLLKLVSEEVSTIAIRFSTFIASGIVFRLNNHLAQFF